MSEFSESYHLKSSQPEEAVAILRAASRKGYVFPSENGWVTFLAADGNFEPDQRIIKANTGHLLHYVFAEDHGWSFTFFDKEKIVLRYRCEWDDDARFDDSKCPEQAFRKFIGDFGVGPADEVWSRLHPANIDEAIEVEVAKLLAEALGLGHYEWLAYRYMVKDFARSPGNFPGLINVG